MQTARAHLDDLAEKERVIAEKEAELAKSRDYQNERDLTSV